MFFNIKNVYLLSLVSMSTIISSFSLAKPVEAKPNFASLVCVTNTTNNDIKLSYGWAGDSWSQMWLDAGHTHLFWHNYDYPNENSAPYFLVGVQTRSQGTLNYNVSGYAANSTDNCDEASDVYVRKSSGKFYVDGDEVRRGHWDGKRGCWCRYVN